jgi:hypothetical protein
VTRAARVCLPLVLLAFLALAPGVQAAAPVEWMPPVSLDDEDSLYFEKGAGISCPTASFCVAIAREGHLLVSEEPDGGTEDWQTFDVDGASEDWFVDISCPTASFCAAIAKEGGLVTSGDPAAGAGSWQRAQLSGATKMTAISCASASLCVAGNELGELFTSSDPSGGAAAWKGFAPPGALEFMGISCPTASFCAAVDIGNHDEEGAWESEIFTSTNPDGGAGAWNAAGVLGSYGTSWDISCASASLCVAAFGEGVLASGEPTGGAAAWDYADLGERLSLLSCPDEGFCAGVDTGMDRTWTSEEPLGGPSAWSDTDTASLDHGAQGLSCPSSGFCAALSWVGDVATSKDPGGGASAWHLATTGGFDGVFTAVSCPEAGFCAAADYNGNVYVSDEPFAAASWTGYTIAPRYLGKISCAGPDLCVVLGERKKVFVSTDPLGGAGTWGESTLPEWAADVACPSASFCVAVAGDEVLISTEPAVPGSWTVTDLELGDEYLGPNRLERVSCPTPSFCAVAGTEGRVLASADPDGGAGTWVESTINGFLPTNFIPAVDDVSCLGPGFCAALWHWRFSSTPAPLAGSESWSHFNVVAGPEPDALSCPSASLCLATRGSYVLADRGFPPSGSAWGQPELLAGAGSLEDISCDTEATICATVDDSAQVFVGVPDPKAFDKSVVVIDEGCAFRPCPADPPGQSGPLPTYPRCDYKPRVRKPKKAKRRGVGQARAVARKRGPRKPHCAGPQQRR